MNRWEMKAHKMDVIHQRLAEGVCRQDIAKELDITPKHLATFCYRYGISLPFWNDGSIERRTKLIKEYIDQGMYRDEIAKVVGLKVISLQDWCYRNNVPLPPSALCGDTKKRGHVVIKVSLPVSIADEIAKEASASNLEFRVFASNILSSVVEGKLYNAVLNE